MELEPFWHHFWTFNIFELFDLKIRFFFWRKSKMNPKNHQYRVKWTQFPIFEGNSVKMTLKMKKIDGFNSVFLTPKNGRTFL